MDKFYISMLTDKKMFDAWYFALAAVKNVEEMKPLDLLIIVEMCRNKQRRKMVEGLLRNMIKKAILTEELTVVAFEKHPAELKQRMTTVTDIADFLITFPDLDLENKSMSLPSSRWEKCVRERFCPNW